MTTQLEQQAAEARALLQDLVMLGHELDDETVELAVASETSLADAVAAALVEAAGAQDAAAATAALIDRLELRRQRQADRAERIRSRIALALGSLGLRKLVTAAGVVSVTAAPPRVIVTDEGALETCWWITKTTTAIDKAGIRQELLAGRDVPGATLSNRQDTIRVRT
jgi:hypothetical protein